MGRVLALSLGKAFLDMDEVLQRRLGAPIGEIVRRHGWGFFRRAERELVRELSAQRGLVVATGGGVVLDPENVRAMRSSGLVVLLWVEPEEIVRRLERDPQEAKRPPLKGDLLREVREVLREREALYLEAAHMVVDGTHRSPAEVAEDILRRVGWGTPSGSCSG